MDFSRYQEEASRSIGRLQLAYTAAVVGVVVVFNALAVAGWWLLFPGVPLPAGFVLVNTLATAGLIVGGTLVERNRLSHDAALLAERMGARRLDPGAAGLSMLERRAVNVLEEMALAARLPIPRLYVLARDDRINALATGLAREDATVVVTQGAIDRLARDELQGVIAHEIAHLASGDVVVHTRLAAMNYGLELVANAGRRVLGDPAGATDQGISVDNRSIGLPMLYLPGMLLLAIGSIGHLAARLLTAAAGRTREFHADALAVRLTRDPNGLGNALRKLAGLERITTAPARLPNALHGLEHAMFHQPASRLAGWLSADWFDTHPPLADRIERLLGPAAAADVPALAPVRGDADERNLAGDLQRSASWLARSALPPLAFTREGPADDGRGRPFRLRAADRPHLVTLVAATRNAHGAAALCALLILGAGQEPEVWPNRWRAAQAGQGALADALKRLGPAAIESLRWPLIETCAATLKPLADPWREELLRMLRGQIELDRRVTLAEWIYYMLLRARLMPLAEAAWRGDERAASPAEAVRWLVALLTRVVGEPALRGERLANDLVRELGLSRTGQSHPPLDVGGLQAAIAALRRLPMLQRPLLMRRLVAWLPAESPIEARDFVRVLALIIDTPMPRFTPLRMQSPDPVTMPTEMTQIRVAP